jgi:hypothetical protein
MSLFPQDPRANVPGRLNTLFRGFIPENLQHGDMRSQRGVSFGPRGDGFQDSDMPMNRGQRPPFGMFITRNSDNLPARLRAMNFDPACHDPRGLFHPLPGRSRDQSRITDVNDEGQLPGSRFGRREGFDPYEEDYYQDRRQIERRRSALSPMHPPSNDRYGDAGTRGRQLEGPRRPSTTGGDRYRDWNPRAGTAREKALPFGKAMK